MRRGSPHRLSSRFLLPVGLALGLALALAGSLGCRQLAPATPGPDAATRARAQAAFTRIAAVLRHPRCLNCHTVTDFPRQGDARAPHLLNVRRGEDDRGSVGMRCSACHQPANQLNGVPGAPSWGLAPLSMGWEGLDDHQLAETLKDRTKNGDRSLDDLLHHMSEDALVDWAWHPGGTRAPVPVSKTQFVEDLQLWIATGASSPDPDARAASITSRGPR